MIQGICKNKNQVFFKVNFTKTIPRILAYQFKIQLELLCKSGFLDFGVWDFDFGILILKLKI
jgi:hypothetical protein